MKSIVNNDRRNGDRRIERERKSETRRETIYMYGWSLDRERDAHRDRDGEMQRDKERETERGRETDRDKESRATI